MDLIGTSLQESREQMQFTLHSPTHLRLEFLHGYGSCKVSRGIDRIPRELVF